MFKTITILVIFSLVSMQSQAQETITNPSVISMTKAKVSKELILDKIKFSPTKFNMNTISMIELKKEGVHETVVDAMMLASSPMPVMHNQDVIDMHLGGVSRNIITKKIQYSESDFSLTTEALIALKTAKVPDPLVKVMMVPKRAVEQSTNPNLVAGALPPHPTTFPIPSRAKFAEPGIYYEEFIKGTPQYEQLEPTTTNQTRRGTVGEAFLNQATSGVSGTTQRVGLANPSANFVIEDNKPVFYMVFSGANRKNMNEVAESIFEGIASPNDFTLLRVKASSRGREFIVGRESAYTSETGFSTGAIPFRFKKISPTLYKIYFDQDISAAEYAFFYNKGSEFTSSIKLYDFSLHNNVK
jgi:hypothetical protein